MDKRIINIALVGHVANGKTTLVNALTGVNTKRSANEQKSGRTIKLGYANCVFWTCGICAQIYTAGQAEKRPECCRTGMNKTAVVSFVDAPGHHTYVHTMVKGATIVDGALLVTDVRKEPMQTQTIEHLAILSILEVYNIIVVQNKADLIGSDQCAKHRAELAKALIGTAAEHSPIIPVSAQNGINLDVLRKLILEMAVGVLGSENPAVGDSAFQVIRSFDVNKPGTEINKLKGGILGGTVKGTAKYAVGDLVEIKPGLVRLDGSYQILQTKISSIFSETQECESTTVGGLYGVGTLLDPCLTHADGLSGSLLGHIGELPDVINTLEMRVTKIDLGIESTEKLIESNTKKRAPKIKPNKQYKLIIGAVVVDAESAASSKPKHICMKLARPICTLENKCLIYDVNKNLVAFGCFGCFGTGQPTAQKIQLSTVNYSDLIQELKPFEATHVRIPFVKLGKENRNIIWSNINEFAKSINRTPAELGNHLSKETLLNVTISANGLRIYKTNINSAKIESILKKYIKEYVVCGQCKSLNTNATMCIDCGAVVRDLRT